MSAPHLRTVQRIATLVKLLVPGLGVQRIQNWCREDYFYQDEPYSFSNFDGVPLSSQQLDFATQEADVTLGNRSERDDALRPVRTWLRAHDGWRRGRVEIVQLWPDDPLAPPFITRLQILSSDLQDGRIDLTLRSPIEAVTAIIPSVHMTHRLVGEIPLVAPQHRFG